MNLPDFFKQLFWSQNFSDLDPRDDRKLIIVNAINYGNLEHWRWLKQFYGKEQVAQVISQIPITELRKRVRPLASMMFGVKQFNNVQRSVER